MFVCHIPTMLHNDNNESEVSNMRFTRETARRAARTFIQAFVSYVAVNIVVIDFTADESIVKPAVVGLIVSAVAAGLSALMNLEKGTAV